MVSHKIISNHKGSISYDSEEGKGTTVEIRLPLS
ncbi:ATP-binding protein [Priestia megaterium]|jgi:signal transduction histidine kinase